MTGRVMDDCPYFNKLAAIDFDALSLSNHIFNLPQGIRYNVGEAMTTARGELLTDQLREILPVLPQQEAAVKALVDFTKEMFATQGKGSLMLFFQTLDEQTESQPINRKGSPVTVFAAVGGLKIAGKPEIKGPILVTSREEILPAPNQHGNSLLVAYVPEVKPATAPKPAASRGQQVAQLTN